jgi:hypothetical protein
MVAAKHPSVRARTNRTAVNAVLRRVKNPKVPALPDGIPPRPWRHQL